MTGELVKLGYRPTDPKMPLEEITADVLYPIAADWTSNATAAKLVNALMTAEEANKEMTKYYKFLTADNTGEYSGFDFTEYLPKGGEPGKWLPLVEELKECETGYHFCDKKNLAERCNAQLFEIEYKGSITHRNGEHLAQQIRFVKKIVQWNDENARLAAHDIAEQIAIVINEELAEAWAEVRAVVRDGVWAVFRANAWAGVMAGAMAGAAARDEANKIICKHAGI